SYRGLLVERGSQIGTSLEVSDFYNTEPIDLELIGSSIIVTNINGEISPAGFVMQSSGGSDLVADNVIDMEPLVSDDNELLGYLILDRMGNVHAYGNAQFFGDTEYIRTIRFGSMNYTQALGNALDLEVAPNPAGGNFGYYIISREGAVNGFGSVTDLPSLDTLVFGSPEAFDLLFDEIGNVNGYRVLTEFGQIIQWTTGSGFTMVQSEVHRSSNGDPIPVDFVEIGDAYYIINERGELFGPNAVSSPKSLLGIIGDRGFFDLEISD
ncbi:hypothetical protein K8I31_14805, partial [bacterium]|nr:hypothetical protein [bacterium]